MVLSYHTPAEKSINNRKSTRLDLFAAFMHERKNHITTEDRIRARMYAEWTCPFFCVDNIQHLNTHNTYDVMFCAAVVAVVMTATKIDEHFFSHRVNFFFFLILFNSFRNNTNWRCLIRKNSCHYNLLIFNWCYQTVLLIIHIAVIRNHSFKFDSGSTLYPIKNTMLPSTFTFNRVYTFQCWCCYWAVFCFCSRK